MHKPKLIQLLSMHTRTLASVAIVLISYLLYPTLLPRLLSILPAAPNMSAPNSTKRGLCWPVENHPSLQTHPFTRPGSKVSWLYNWSPNPTPGSSLPFVPMQWSGAGAAELDSKFSSSPAPSAAILGFNEPERGDQANMTPSAAAEVWLAHIEPLRRRGVRAGSPGPSSCEEGVLWLQEFTRLIRAGGSNVDFWALHWYGEGLGGFYDFIWSTHHRLDPGIPVWITEFACTNWNADQPLGREVVESFLRESAKYLDGLDWVERYAWFGPMKDTGMVGKWAALLDGEGGISDLGRIYRDL